MTFARPAVVRAFVNSFILATLATVFSLGITVTIQQYDTGTFWSLGDQKSGDSWKRRSTDW